VAQHQSIHRAHFAPVWVAQYGAVYPRSTSNQKLRQRLERYSSKSIDKKAIQDRPLTVVAAMEQLARVMAVPVKIKKNTIWLRTDISPNAVKLMKAIDIKIPPKILPKKGKM